MPSLKIHGPKRRESERRKNQHVLSQTNNTSNDSGSQHPSMIASSQTIQQSFAASSRHEYGTSSAEDAKKFGHKPTFDVDGINNHREEFLEETINNATPSHIVLDIPAPQREYNRHSQRQDDMLRMPQVPQLPFSRHAHFNNTGTTEIDSDDEVEEYDFSNETEMEDDESEGFDNNDEHFQSDRSIITISDDDGGRAQTQNTTDDSAAYPLDLRPWQDFNYEQRYRWEEMYSVHREGHMHDSWESTEAYHKEKDEEMALYLEDFPLEKWVIPKCQAVQAYDNMVERRKWRSLGIRIYSQNTMPAYMISAPATHMSYQRTTGYMPNVQMTGQHSSYSGNPHQMPHPQQMIRDAQNIPQVVSTPAVVPGPAYQPTARRSSNQVNMADGASITRQISTTTMPGSQNYNVQNDQVFHIPAPLPPPTPTPPYPVRDRPYERRNLDRHGRQSKRKGAEAECFPWFRQMDFEKEKANATWDDSIYSSDTLGRMAATRKRNEPILARIEAEMQEQLRYARMAKNAKKDAAKPPDGSDDTANTDQEWIKQDTAPKTRLKDSANIGGDHSGTFAFVSPSDYDKAKKFGKRNPMEIIDAALEGKIDVQSLGDIQICWNPTKKGITEELEHCSFSVRDSVATRKQIQTRPILTRTAAERICDFCPDLVWRDMLLRMVSEAGYGNKDLRDRFCLNGWYCDKATMTKRISAALGQKQVTKATKGMQRPEDDEWYNLSIHEFANYVEYFGKRSNHRTAAVKAVKAKRAYMTPPGNKLDSESDVEILHVGIANKPKANGNSIQVDRLAHAKPTEDEAQTSGQETEVDSHAVSLQNSDDIDMLSD